MAKEILNGSQITADDFVWTPICNELIIVADISGRWKPAKGIYCDDLIAIAECGVKKLLFLTEVKGTTLKEGLSHSMEAKIFYQLARTCMTLRQKLPSGPGLPNQGCNYGSDYSRLEEDHNQRAQGVRRTRIFP